MSHDLVLNPIQNGGISPTRHKQNLSPSKELKKLKFELSDCLFELRKQEEDFAQAKAYLIITHNEQKKALNLKIKELNNKIAEDNEQWTTKIDEIKKQCELKIADNDSRWAQELGQRVNSTVQTIIHEQYQSVLQSQTQQSEQLKAQITELTRRNTATVDHLEDSHQKQLANIKQIHEAQLKDLKEDLLKEHQAKISDMVQAMAQSKKDYLNAQTGLERLRKEQQLKYSHYQGVIRERDRVIESLNSSSAVLEQENGKLKQQLSESNRKLCRSLNMTEEEYGNKLRQAEKEWGEKFEISNQKWKEECTKLQGNLEKIQTAYRDRQRAWEERAQKVFTLSDSREAREEDVKLIENLQIQLIRKDFQLEREKQELKSAKLELENMDDIYKRIFYSASSHHSSSSTKNHKNSTSFHLKKVRLPGIGNRSTHPVKNLADYS